MTTFEVGPKVLDSQSKKEEESFAFHISNFWQAKICKSLCKAIFPLLEQSPSRNMSHGSMSKAPNISINYRFLF
jgi:hypothetical protein